MTVKQLRPVAPGRVPAVGPGKGRSRLLVMMEIMTLGLAALGPWAFYCTSAVFETALYAGLAILMSLWAARILLDGPVPTRPCLATGCLVGMLLLALLQLLPLPFLVGLSPNTAKIYQRLLPALAESLPFGLPRLQPDPPAGSTLSLAPAGTRIRLTQFIAVILLFTCVRNNFATRGFVRRLCVMAVVNGGLLALLGLLQYYSSPHDTIYWSIKSKGDMFITVGRNHAPFYLNLCIGLGIGLFLWRSSARNEGGSSLEDAFLGLLRDPARLWILASVLLMIVAVFVSQSRSAFTALIGGGAAFVAFRLAHTRVRPAHIAGGIGFLVLLGLTLRFLDFNWTNARVKQTLVAASLADETRITIWNNALEICQEFPIWGTGFGAFGFVESPRHRVAGNNVFLGTAYNEFLGAMVEGGAVGFVLVLGFTWAVFSAGYRAYRREPKSASGGLVLGMMVALVTMIIHGCFDPAIHMPANAFLATVVVASLSSAEKLAGTRSSSSAEGLGLSMTPSRAIGSAMAAGAVAFLGLVPFREGVRNVKSEQAVHSAKAALADHAPSAAGMEIEFLRSAVEQRPEGGWIRLELAEAYSRAFNEQSGIAKTQNAVQSVAAALACLAPVDELVLAAAETSVAAFQQERLQAEERALVRQYLGPALQQYLLARDLCPLLAPVHARLATYWDYLEQKEPRERYLERAKELLPGDPEFWYYCGKAEFGDQRIDAACASWRHSLELEPTYLSQILARSRQSLSAAQVLESIVPDKPSIIYRALSELFKKPEATQEGRQHLERIIQLVSCTPILSRVPEDWRVQGGAYAKPGELDKSIKAYEMALLLSPQQTDWRLEFARVLFDRGLPLLAVKQLQFILARDPNNQAATRLLRYRAEP